jgi:anthranilate phosphoribosyltransferase
VRVETVHPSDVGIATASADALRGGDVAVNVDVTRRFLDGASGPVRDAVLLNAAAALVAYDGPTAAPVAEQLATMLSRAAAAVDSGAARAALDRWVTVSQSQR